jgi:IS30 family transposase
VWELRKDLELELKIYFGHLKADTLVEKDYQAAIITINGRALWIFTMKATANSEVFKVNQVIKDRLKEWIPYSRTITADKGKEFPIYSEIAESGQLNFYFANPFCT